MGAACLRDESALYQLCTDDLLLRLLMTRQTVPSANCCANGANGDVQRIKRRRSGSQL